MKKPFQMPAVIYAVHSDYKELRADGFMEAVQRDPEHWFRCGTRQVYGVYRLIEVKMLEPRPHQFDPKVKK